MPDPPRTVTDAEHFKAEAARLFKDAVDGLDADQKRRVADAVRRGSAYAQQLLTMAPDDPQRGRVMSALRAEKSTIQNILWADTVRSANALVRGVMSSALDLVLRVGLAAL